MAINVTVLNEDNSKTGQIQLDFVLDILASEDDYTTPNTECEFYFKMNTSTKQIGGGDIPVKVTKSLSDRSLNGTHQSRPAVAPVIQTDPYASITDMVEDYLFEFIHGHTANQYTSSVTAQGAWIR